VWLEVSLIVFAAVLLQSVVGFGSAMVAMALLSPLLGLNVASPLVALVAATLEAVMVFRYRQAAQWSVIRRLLVGTLPAIPLGILALSRVPEAWLLTVLGVVILSYTVYALAGRRLPELRGAGWAYSAGALAGLLSGAYNVGGPPLILYGDCQRWPPAEFKGNLQNIFLINDAVVLTFHALAGNVTPGVLTHYLAALPAVALGVLLGLALDRRVSPAAFRALALLTLLVLGARLLWTALV
jgi:hypothetical protein